MKSSITLLIIAAFVFSIWSFSNEFRDSNFSVEAKAMSVTGITLRKLHDGRDGYGYGANGNRNGNGNGNGNGNCNGKGNGNGNGNGDGSGNGNGYGNGNCNGGAGGGCIPIPCGNADFVCGLLTTKEGEGCFCHAKTGMCTGTTKKTQTPMGMISILPKVVENP